MIKYLHVLLVFVFIVSCNNEKQDDTVKNEKGWVAVKDTTLINEDVLPQVTEIKPKADSTLASILPNKLIDYIADSEVQNANDKTSNGKVLKSVVRIYRKADKMIGINVTDFSQLTNDERTEIFKYHFNTLLKLNKNKTSKIEDVKIDKYSHAKLFYSKNINKAICYIVVTNELLVTINTDCSLNYSNFKNLIGQIDIKKLERLKNI